MGRQSTGALSTKEVQRIELSYLQKQRMIIKGCKVSGSLSWNDGSWIRFDSAFTEDEKYLRLKYNTTNNNTGEKSEHDYKIWLTSIPSNLGKGEVLYFVCPHSGRRARILYRCYGSLIWKSRKAYQHRIYYNSQISSKLSKNNDRFWEISREIDKCYLRSKKSHYQGQETRLGRRIRILEEKQDYHDSARMFDLPKSLMKKLI